MLKVPESWIKGVDYEFTSGVITTHFGDKVQYQWWIGLKALWSEEYKEFRTDEIGWENVIYACVNQVNNKVYIGKAKDFFNRWIESNWSHYNRWIENHNFILYHALNKYNIDKFKVYIIYECNSNDLLNELEIKFINKFNSCVLNDNSWGYNMTYGGEDTSQLRTPKALAKSRKSLECYAHSIGFESYGKYASSLMMTPEARSKADNTCIKKYDMTACELMISPENIKRSLSTRNDLYGDNGAGAMHTSKSRNLAELTRHVNSINNHINLILDAKLELNYYNFIRKSSDINNIRFIDNL